MDNETTIKTKAGMRLVVSDWINGGMWMMVSTDSTTICSASVSTLLTVDELDQLIKGLQAIQEATK